MLLGGQLSPGQEVTVDVDDGLLSFGVSGAGVSEAGVSGAGASGA